MYRAEIVSVTVGKSQLEKYKVWLTVDYHGVEEEAVFRYEKIEDIPSFLIEVENGNITYLKGQEVYVSHPFEDANGLVFLDIHESASD